MSPIENPLVFSGKLLQTSVFPRVQEYIKQRKTSEPVVVEFDPTTACQFACPDCINFSLLNKGQIAPQRTLELIEEFQKSGVQAIIFIGGGEPLAHTGIPDPIVRAHELGISVGLTTNGLLVGQYLDAIAKHAEWTRVSVDAATPETFSIFRPSHIPRSFEEVTENIKALSQVKQGHLGFSFLMQERHLANGETITNCHEVYDAAVLAQKLGTDYFEYKPMVDKYHNLIPFSDKIRQSLLEQLSALNGLNTEDFQVIAPGSINHLLNTVKPGQPKQYTTCPMLELRTVVTPTGIYPCPYKRGHEDEKIGELNVLFDEYWRSQERIQRARSVNPSTDCPFYCIRHQSNVELYEAAEAYDAFVNLLFDMPGTE